MKKLTLFNKILYVANSIVAVLLLFSYLLPYVSPNVVATFAILSLFVPFLLIINIGFLVYWIVKLKKQFLTSLVILIIGWFFISPFYKITSKNDASNNDLKLMSYNVRMFNHWKWTKEKNIPAKIKKFIAENDPDVIAIQENISIKEYELDFKYNYIKKKHKRGRFGAAIYSKYPIVNEGYIEFKNTSNEIIFADILKEKDTIRIYNFHLQSLKISPEKENFGEENSQKLIQNLKEKFTQQAEQVALFLEHEKTWKGKKVICGDFNNTAYSWVYNQISKNKKDAFIEAGKGFGKTFNYWFPMRIDFILTDATATVNQFKNFSEKYSDHYAIYARVNW
ncbi:endonuclease/exonuclease/phosphatase family protein [uncultured Polaribacter sp.]|uniref:endonuclease/exonuclease/phosphatase family protein n=1 Tax=uncultured Polaribacter sp. TaxID=174711 RepID=UPI00261C1740|nr:endonuclease/exonuclease/phosphatase family protein [uncultured Polaribacter sp.]